MLETILCFSYTRFNSSPIILVVGFVVNVKVLGVDLVELHWKAVKTLLAGRLK